MGRQAEGSTKNAKEKKEKWEREGKEASYKLTRQISNLKKSAEDLKDEIKKSFQKNRREYIC